MHGTKKSPHNVNKTVFKFKSRKSGQSLLKTFFNVCLEPLNHAAMRNPIKFLSLELVFCFSFFYLEVVFEKKESQRAGKSGFMTFESG